MRKRTTPRNLHEIEAQRICIIKPSALGDIVQSLPLLPVLKERFPDATVSWVLKRELIDILRGHPSLDDIIAFDRRGSVRNWIRLLSELRGKQFDLVFDLQGLLRTGVMTLATAARMRVGLQTAREGSHLAYNFVIPQTGRKVPAHMRYWRVLEAIGKPDCPRETIVQVSRADREWVKRQLNEIKRPILAIHPGAHWITKRWPFERFGVVACKAMRHYGFAVVIVGAESEKTPSPSHHESRAYQP